MELVIADSATLPEDMTAATERLAEIEDELAIYEEQEAEAQRVQEEIAAAKAQLAEDMRLAEE